MINKMNKLNYKILFVTVLSLCVFGGGFFYMKPPQAITEKQVISHAVENKSNSKVESHNEETTTTSKDKRVNVLTKAELKLINDWVVDEFPGVYYAIENGKIVNKNRLDKYIELNENELRSLVQQGDYDAKYALAQKLLAESGGDFSKYNPKAMEAKQYLDERIDHGDKASIKVLAHLYQVNFYRPIKKNGEEILMVDNDAIQNYYKYMELAEMRGVQSGEIAFLKVDVAEVVDLPKAVNLDQLLVKGREEAKLQYGTMQANQLSKGLAPFSKNMPIDVRKVFEKAKQERLDGHS